MVKHPDHTTTALHVPACTPYLFHPFFVFEDTVSAHIITTGLREEEEEEDEEEKKMEEA